MKLFNKFSQSNLTENKKGYEPRVLKILDTFQPFFDLFKVDYPVMRHILATKLLIDKRRVSSIFGEGSNKKQNTLVKSLWIYFLYSFILVFFIFGDDYMVQMSIIFGIALFILMTALIADFSSVMLDVRDRIIMQTKPINNRTIGISKFIHILIYLSLITGAFTIVPIIFMLFKQGIIFTVLFMVLLALFLLFIIVLTSLMYIFVLKLFSGEQLKSLINYIQIIFAVGIIIGYQLVIRSYGFIDLEAAYVFEWWHLLLPPMWFAAPFELILHQHVSIQLIALSLLTIIVPITAFVIYIWLIPHFEANLQKLLAVNQSKVRIKVNLESLWKRLLCRTVESRAYFQFVYRIADREREFKLKVYPSLGIGIILPFIFIFSEYGVRTLEEIAASDLYFCIYLMHIFIGIAIYTFQFSSNYRGSWIYTMTGDDTISFQLYKAVIKVFLAKLYVPMFIIVGAVYYIIFENFQLIDLGIVFISAILQAILSYKISIESNYPFSLSYEILLDGGNMGKAFLLMLLTLPFVIFHFLSTLLPFMAYLYFIVLIVTAYILAKRLFEKPAVHEGGPASGRD